MLKIRKHFSLADFEEGLSKLADGETVLQLPNMVKANAVGCQAALLQLICTWARTRDQDAILRLHASSIAEKSYQNFITTPAGLVSVNLARRIENLTGDEVSRSSALALAYEYVKLMHEGNLNDLRAYAKTVIPLLCIDNARELRRPKRLYDQANGEVLPRAYFESLISAIMEEMPRFKSTRRRDDLVIPMASLLYEAFLNTHEHAQTDFKGDLYPRSVRGMLFSFHYVDRSEFASMAGNSAPLKKYFEGWSPRKSNGVKAEFLELSIFDCGPGFADSWLSRRNIQSRPIKNSTVSIAEELEAVKQCLEKGGTTKHSGTTGNGLFRITQVVKRAAGFIRIRTGHLSLIKAFSPSGSGTLPSEDTDFEDMIEGGIPTKRAAWADGTTITVIIPLNRAAQ